VQRIGPRRRPTVGTAGTAGVGVGVPVSLGGFERRRFQLWPFHGRTATVAAAGTATACNGGGAFGARVVVVVAFIGTTSGCEGTVALHDRRFRRGPPLLIGQFWSSAATAAAAASCSRHKGLGGGADLAVVFFFLPFRLDCCCADALQFGGLHFAQA